MQFHRTVISSAIVMGLALAGAPCSYAATPVDVKIGFAAPLTGGQAHYGADFRSGCNSPSRT